jgi:brefeldin A-inhibited guanine nucleotide-exchange protein
VSPPAPSYHLSSIDLSRRLTNVFRLCADIIRSFTLLDDETQQRNILAWRPVVIDVLEGYTHFPTESFGKHINTFYPLAVTLLEKEVGTEMRGALWGMFRRVGEIKFGMPEYVRPRENSLSSITPTSPRGERTEWTRRGSRVSRTGP